MPRANRHHWLLTINLGELLNFCDFWDAKITKFTYLAISIFKNRRYVESLAKVTKISL